MNNTSKRCSPEVRERAVRLVLEHQGEHPVDILGPLTQVFYFQLTRPPFQVFEGKQPVAAKIVGKSKCKCWVN